MQVELITKQKIAAKTRVVAVAEGPKLSPAVKALDTESNGAISQAMAISNFKGEQMEIMDLIAPIPRIDRLILVGLGKNLDQLQAEDLGGKIYHHLQSKKVTSAVLDFDGPIVEGPEFDATSLIALATGLLLRSYGFDHYHTKKENKSFHLEEVALVVANPDDLKPALDQAKALVSGTFMARDLVSEPPNVLFPASYCDRVETLSEIGIEVEILDEEKMAELGMGALLGVGIGSSKESRLAIMQWHGGQSDDAPVALVGKGVTFDTGGISLKPGAGMEDMKFDMAGSAVVVGVMKTLALRKAKVNVVGVIGLVENMPDGNAQRPADIVTSISGQTIEIHNTDAEGRLVLADALWYTQTRFTPIEMIDLATLTGAIIISLGHEYAGLFSNSDELSNALIAAGENTGEKVWRLPLHKNFDKQIKSDIADMKNIGGRAAGSITAAQFLQRFVKDTAWAHLDIAGVAWQKKDQPTVPKGASAFGVRLLDRYIRDRFEQ